MAKHIPLTSKSRTILGNQVRILRREKQIPAVIYSKTFPSTPIQLVENEFLKAYKLSGKTHVIDLSVDEKVYPCIVHALDIHPVRGTVRHIDFLLVNLKEKITSVVPITYIGIAEGIKSLGAVLNINLNKVEVTALPDNLPSEIVVDVTALATFEDAVYVRDLPKTNLYEFASEADELVVSLTQQSQEEELETPVTEVVTAVEVKPGEVKK